jgi:hypothetical protein
MRPLPALLLIALVPALTGSTPDPGVLLEVDLARFSLHARDLSSAVPGPTLRVAVGSPAHPTPTGEFHPVRVVRNPGFVPGAHARGLGARPLPPSGDSPLGVGKIPLEYGAIQIHAGADPLELGKPVSLGCVSVVDESWLALIDWLHSRGSLHPWRASPDGALVSGFRRPIRVVVHE